MIGRLVIVGVGLIGGSFALALRAAGAVGEVVGVGRRPENLAAAVELGAIDRVGALDRTTFADADLVLLAAPVGDIARHAVEVAALAGPGTIVTDAGSTKSNVVAAIASVPEAARKSFVPGHPIAGAEKSGVRAASADLFRDHTVVLTPTADTDPAAAERVRAAWGACGARVVVMTAEDHDRTFAAVSHLPHLLSFALVEEFARRPEAARLFDFAAGGFRDFTRIAASDPDMWRDIALANRDALLSELERYLARVAGLKAMVEAADGAGLRAAFELARNARVAWGQKPARR
jgi:prephenate dehydrogenase